MSKTIKIQSTKNGFKVVKTKAIANEKYIIADETGKTLNKLKFVQKNKNLEIYTEVDGKEQQVVTLEDYYAPDMNASVVGLSETNEELAYVYNENDGWYYLLNDTELGFAFPLVGLGAAAGVGIAAVGGSGGNDGNGSNTSSVDTTPPTAGTLSLSNYTDSGSSATDNITNDNTFDLTISGQETGSTVVYEVSTDGGTTWVATTANQSGLTDGTYNFRATVTDASGNSATTPVQTVTVDTAITAGTLSLSNYTDSGSSATDNITNDNTFDLTISGQETGSTVVYEVSTDGGTTWVATTANQSGLTDGTYNFRATVTDASGNSATTPVQTVTVDTAITAGTLSLSNYTDSGSSATDNITNDNTFDLTISGQETGSTVVYEVSTDGGTTWVATTANQSGLTDGTYNFRATVTDASGNSATTPVQTVTVDTAITAGTLSLSNYTDSGSSATDNITNDNTFDLTISGQETGSTVVYEVSTDGGTTWVATTANQSGLTDGTYNFRATVTDASGNSATTPVQTVTVDTAITAGTLSLSNYTDSGSSATDNITNDNTFDLTISGQETGSTVVYEVSTDGGATWTTTTANQSSLTDGTYNFRATVTDASGNSATTPVQTVTVDTAITAGTLSLSNYTDSGSSATDNITNDNTFDLTISGQETGSTVVYEVSTDGGTTWVATTANQSGLTDGTYNFRATVTDASGNSATTPVQTVTVDTAITAGTLSLSNYTDSGSSATDNITNDNTFDLTISGQETGSTVVYEVSTDGGATWTTTTANQSSLTDGTYNFRATVTDASGNSATTPVQTVTVDTAITAGTLSLSNYTDSGSSATDNITNDNTFDLTISGQETGSTVVYEVSTDGGATWTTTTANQSSLTDGTYNFRATVTDASGNSATTPVQTVTVDTAITAGTLSLSNYTDSGSSATDNITNDNTFDLTISGQETGSTVVYEVSTDGGATWTTTTANQSSLTDGTYNFRATVTDASGNSATTPVQTVTVDTAITAGTLSLSNYTDSGSSATDNITNDNTFDLTISGQETGSTVVYEVSTNGGGTWTTTTANQSSLTDGTYNFRATVTDASGNSATTPVQTVTVDTAITAGTLSLSNYTDSGSSATDNITNDNTFDLTISGQETGSTVVYEVSTNGGGTWTTTTANQSSLTDGTYNFRATVTDASGNSATTPVQTVTVDTAITAGTLSLSNYTDSGSSATDNITNDNTFDLTISGQETGSTVVYEVSTNGGGTWVATTANQSSLTDGTYNFRATVTDASGNSATTPVQTVTVDTAITAGTLSLSNYTDSGSSATDNITNDNTFDLTISGQETGSTVVYEVSTNGGGTWTTTTANQSSLTDGTYNFRATVTDASGNSATTPVQTVTVDTAITAGTLSLSNYTDSGSSATDNITNDNTFDLTISGQETGSTVVYEVSTNGGGTWTTTTANQSSLTDGTYNFRATVTDASGNSATTPVQTVTVDTAITAGTLSLSNYTDSGSSATDNITNDNTFDLTISGQETGSTVVYEVSTNGGGTWTTTTANQSSLTDGTYNFRATVTDASGNSATTPVQTVTVDTAITAGTLSLSNYTDSGSSATDNITNDNTFDLTISGQETGSTVVYEVSTNGGGTWTTTTANQSSLTDGTYNFRATVTDASGNSATTPVQTVTVDTAITAGTLSLSNYTDSGSSATDNITNDNTFDLTISGQETGSTVVYEVSTNGGGTWTTTTANQSSLTDGTYNFRATVTDASGNSATTPVQTVTVDTAITAGTLSLSNYTDSGSSATDNITNDNTFDLTISGQETGSTVVYEVSTNGGGTWTTTTANQSSLTDGTYNFRATVTDASGNSATTPVQTVTVDTAITAGTLSLSNYTDSGSSATDNITNDNTFDLTISGQETGSTVVYEVSTNGGGTWTTTTANQSSLTDGTYNFRATVTDASGNSATTPVQTVTVDTAITAGTLSLSNYTDSGSSATDNITNDNTFDLTISGQETGSTVVYEVSTNGGGTWTTTTANQSSLTDGTYNFRATVTDASGNSATTPVQTVTVDTAITAGTLSLSNYTDSGSSATDNITNDNTFDLTISGQETGSTVVYEVSTNGGGTWTTTTANQSSLTDGTYNFRATVTDASGNSATTPVQTVTVDTAITAGTLSLSNYTDSGSSATDNITNDNTFDLTISGQETGSTVVYEVSTNGGGTWTTTTANQSSLTDGTYNFRATVTDASGNSATTPVQTVTVDTAITAGTLSLSNYTDSGSSATDNITNDNTFDLTISGQETGSTVVYEVSTNGGGTWTTTTANQSSLTDGTYNFRATVTDASGNSATTPVQTVTVDTAITAGTLSLSNYTDSGSSATDNITNDNTFDLTISGQETGSTVVYEVSTNGGGTWTTTTANQSSLTDGTYNFRATVTDASGNSATTPVQTVTVDTAITAGTLSLSNYTDSGSSATDNITNDNTFDLTISGQETGSTVVYEVSTNGGGTWTTTTANQSSLTDGTYNFRATVTDASGNSATTPVQTVTVDTAITAGTLSLSNYTDSGSSATDNITNDNTFDLTISGQETGSTVVYEVSTNGGGTWTTTTANQSSLTDGTYNFRATVTDASGNSATTPVQTVTVDTAITAGTLSLSNYTDSGSSATDNITNDNTFDLTISGQETGSTVVYEVSTNGGGTWTTTTANQSSLTDGTYNFRATVTDASGNSATTPVQTVTVDTAITAGTLSLSNYTDSGSSATDNITNDNTFDLTISGQETGSTVVYEVSTNGGGTWTTTTANQSSLTDGTYNFRATVTDASGNSATTPVQTVTVDTAITAGTLSLSNYTDSGSSATDNITNDNTFDLTISGQETGSTVVYQISTDGGGTWTTTTANQSSLTDGTYNFRATVTDASGNSATTPVQTVTVDTAITAGTLSLSNYTDSGSSATDNITNDNTFDLTISGQETGSTVVYEVSTDGGATWTTTTANQSSLTDGTYNFRATVTDASGNSATTPVQTVTVDTAITAGTLSLSNYTDSGSSATDNITNDNTFDLTISGQETGSTVVYEVSTNGGGTWTTTTANQSSLTDGTYNFRATVTDASGNSATTPVQSVTIDTTVPDFPIINVQSSQVKLEDTGVINGMDSYPQITAVGTAGEYVVTYHGTDSDGDESIFVQKFNADGTIQGSQVKLEATSVTNNHDNYPQITAVGTAGEYVVTYQGTDSDGDDSIFVQKFNADGTIQGSQVKLEATSVTNKYDSSPQITAVGTAGEYVVTYHGTDSDGDDSIFVQKFNADGTIQGSQVKLEATGVTNGDDYEPQITAVGNAGEYVVTYRGRDSNGDNSIFVQKFNANGTIQGSQVMLEATGVTNGDDYVPQIKAVGNAGEYVVTYQGTDSDGDDSIFVQKFNADGTIQGSQVKLEATGVINGMDSYPQITAVGTAGEYVVTYYGFDSDGDDSIFVQKFNADGTTQGAQVKLEGTGFGGDYFPQITAVGTAGEYVVTYQGTDSDGDDSIFVQKFNADGTIQGSQVKLEATGVTNDYDFFPQITAVGTAGEYVVTYHGVDSNGDYSIFVQKFNADGTLANLVEAVTVAENTANTTVVFDANATDNGGANDVGITYSISGGVDANKFTINSSGEVRFITSPDYENPTDVGGNNVYDIIIKATDSAGNSTDKNVAISVTDVALGPVVIDLDRDGNISYTQKIMDVNSDGIIDKTAWVDKNDGVLIWDKYQDGKVHDSSQYELSQYGGNTGLEGLTIGFDTNRDGVFDLKDEKFSQFSIWQDLNNDGISQDGEVKTLTDWGINSINLTSDGITKIDDAGVIEAGRTTATKTDGSEVVIGDAGFEYTTAQDDSIFASLQIWVDTNVDGKTNSGELYKLEDLNVKSLDLNSQNTSSIDNGNIQGLVSNWTDTNDNSHEMVDVWFKTQEVTQNTISETSTWTTSTVSEVNNQSYAVYANTQIVIDEESKTQNII